MVGNLGRQSACRCRAGTGDLSGAGDLRSADAAHEKITAIGGRAAAPDGRCARVSRSWRACPGNSRARRGSVVRPTHPTACERHGRGSGEIAGRSPDSRPAPPSLSVNACHAPKGRPVLNAQTPTPGDWPRDSSHAAPAAEFRHREQDQDIDSLRHLPALSDRARQEPCRGPARRRASGPAHFRHLIAAAKPHAAGASHAAAKPPAAALGLRRPAWRASRPARHRGPACATVLVAQ